MPEGVYRVGADAWTFDGAPHWYRSKRKANLAYKRKYGRDPRPHMAEPIIIQPAAKAAIAPVAALIPSTTTTRNGVDYVSAGFQLPEWVQDIVQGLDPWIPEELLPFGIDITPGVRVGAETKGRVLYDNVWIEDGKVKVVRKGNLRVLGYTPQEAKKRFKTRRRRKRLTKRDIYIIEALKDGASPAAIALI